MLDYKMVKVDNLVSHLLQYFFLPIELSIHHFFYWKTSYSNNYHLLNVIYSEISIKGKMISLYNSFHFILFCHLYLIVNLLIKVKSHITKFRRKKTL